LKKYENYIYGLQGPGFPTFESLLRFNATYSGIPKPLLFLSALNGINSLKTDYQYTWFLDDDISFQDFDLKKYFSFATDGFFGNGTKPLIMQPLISDNSSYYKYLNAYSKHMQSPHAVAVEIVEIMLPFINTKYFKW